MLRRKFIQLVGISTAWPLVAHAQRKTADTRKMKIGVLWHAGNAEEEHEYLSVLTKAFNDLGYIEGKNVEFLHKFPAERPDRYLALAKELVDSNVDVVVAVSTDGAVALKQFTQTIPVVFVLVPDPVGFGLVAS